MLLAAGRGERFGADKLLAPLPRDAHGVAAGTPVALAAARALVACIPESVAVVRPGASALARALADEGLRVVVCPFADQGMGASLAFGIAAAADADGWVIALGDMPWVAPGTIRRVVDALTAGAPIALPVVDGARGHPVAFSAAFRDALLQQGGDRGAKAILAAHAGEIVEVVVGDPGVLRDVDTPQDLQR